MEQKQLNGCVIIKILWQSYANSVATVLTFLMIKKRIKLFIAIP